MKNRLTAIDGLRGFAALSVVISHIGINLEPIVNLPLINFLFRIISSGTTAVQLFFVLSGFLIGYLYPVISNRWQYLGKRYLRIMPLYAAIVVYIWRWQFHGSPGLGKSLIELLMLALIVHVFWRLIKRGRWLLYLFLFFQFGFFIFSLTIMPRLIAGGGLSQFHHDLLYMLSNLSLTMYLQKRLLVLNGVFWSLVPEMVFYLIYPFIILPLIQWVSRKKFWLILFFSLAVIKILFDLDAASRAFYSVYGIFISRASGFVIGLALGRIYLNQGKLWLKMKNWLSAPLVGMGILAIFFLSLGWEWPDKFYQIREYVAFHFLGISMIFGLTLATGLIAGSLVNRIFSQKFLVFSGMISYSLYLIHPEVVEQLNWHPFWTSWSNNLSVGWQNLAKIIFFGGLCILVAWLLYWLIERLYFVTKSKSLKLAETNKIYSLSRSRLIFPVVAAATLILWIYSGDYSPSLIMSRHSLNFQAKHNNLAVVFLPLDYVRNPSSDQNNTQLIFTLMNANNEIVFTSSRSAQQVEGMPMYPFGFPVQTDSKNRKYSVAVDLVNPTADETLHLNSSFGTVSQYIPEKSQDLTYFINLAYQRLLFVLSFAQVKFALIILASLFLI